MNPYHLTCLIKSDDLFQLDNGDFQLQTGGDISPLMIGFDYVLAEKPLAEVITKLASNVLKSEATIIRRRTDEVITTHARLNIGTDFSLESIGGLDLRGFQCYLFCRSNLFVSPNLRDALCTPEYDYLEFSEGLQGFVA